MTLRFFLAFLLLVRGAAAVITEWYVTDAGAGTGTTSGTPMSFTVFLDHMATGGSVNAAAGARYNILGPITARAGTTDTFSNAGTATAPIIVRGYSGSDITNGYQGRDSVGVLTTTNMPTLTYTTGGITVTGAFVIIESLKIDTGRAGYSVSYSSGTDGVVVRCAVSNSGTNALSGGIGLQANRTSAFDCDVNCTGASGGGSAAGILVFTTGCVADSCRVKVVSASSPGINPQGATIVYGCTIYGSGGVGIDATSTSGSVYLRNNTIVGCAGDGINIITGTTGIQKIIGNMITDSTAGYGIDMVSTANAALIAYNRTRDNSSGGINSGTDWVAATSYGNVTTDTGTSATDYVNFGANNFNLVSTSPATSTSVPAKASAGALQRDQTGAGGSTGYSATFAQ